MRSRVMLSVVGCHAEGEVGDVIVGGFPAPPGATMFERMRTMERDFDHIRRFLLCEPRGSVCRHVNLLTPPLRPGCDYGVIIMEPTEYVPMSGSNLLCTVTVLPRDRCSGDEGARDDRDDGHASRTGQGSGGMSRWAMPLGGVRKRSQLRGSTGRDGRSCRPWHRCRQRRVWRDVLRDRQRDEARLSRRALRSARARGGRRANPAHAREQLEVIHPENVGIRGVSIVQLNRPFEGVGRVSRNTCIVAPGRSDRSPTGTGTCARLAVLHARGQMVVGDAMIHESIIGSRFHGRIVSATSVGGRPAIVPAIRGRAWITGFHTYLLDPDDPYPEGYLLPDSWGVTGTLAQ